MTWLFSKALCESLPYLPEQAVESSEDTCSDGEPYAQLNVMPTPHKFWRNDKTMDASRLSRFGLTLRLLTESHGEAVLTLFLEAFPVKTYPQPEGEKELPEQGRVSGLSSLVSLAKYDQDSFLWKTPQYSLLGDWELYSETWPRWGTMQNGECWERQTLERPTSENESGFWPTPNVPNGGRSLAHVSDFSESGRSAYHNGKKVQVGLEAAVKMWPTPCARDYRGAGKSRMERTGGKQGENLPQAVGGSLNPDWVEWLMGWPIGWTDVRPLEMVKFHEWQQQHSLDCKSVDQPQFDDQDIASYAAETMK